MTRIIAISSGKGGVGKTFFTANLGIAIAKLGKKVIMVDADLDMANLELVLGMEGRPITLQDVLRGEAQVQDAIYDVAENAKFVPAGISPAQFKRVDPEKLADVIKEIATFADYVLLDCPAGVGRDTIACFAACEETIIIMTPEPMSATDAYKTRIVAEKMGSDIIGVVLNMVKGLRNEMKDSDISTLLEAPILAKIPDDAEVRISTINGKQIIRTNPGNPASVIIQRIAAKLTGAVTIPEEPRKKFSLFGFLRRKR